MTQGQSILAGHPIINHGRRIVRASHWGPPYLWYSLRARFRRGPSHNLRTYAHLRRTHDRSYYLTLRFISSGAEPIGVLPVSSWTIDPRLYARGDKYARLAYTHWNAFFGLPKTLDVSGKTLICDDPGSEALKRCWKKVIHVNYDFSCPRGAVGEYLIMPYTMHPLQYASGLDVTSAALRKTRRKIWLFFSGNMDLNIYSRSPLMLSISERFGIFNRPDVLATVRTAMGTKLREIGGDRDVALIRQAEETFACVLTPVASPKGNG